LSYQGENGLSGRLRSCGPFLPREVLFLAELHSDGALQGF
jgi:hypothetical protein